MSVEKKQVWHYSEIETDEETKKLMPGFEIQYMITDETVSGNEEAVFGHCRFPPRTQHFAHKHLAAAEVVYVISGRVVNGGVEQDESIVEYECGAGKAIFVPKGQIHWTRNPFDEPCECVFAYFGAPSLMKTDYVDMKDLVDIANAPVSGKLVHERKVGIALT